MGRWIVTALTVLTHFFGLTAYARAWVVKPKMASAPSVASLPPREKRERQGSATDAILIWCSSRVEGKMI
jgi:hypothetical protein